MFNRPFGMMPGMGGMGGTPPVPMTPGSGMPPYGQNMPFNVGQQQPMQPGGIAQSNVPVQQPGQGQGMMNPASMGMLSSMLAKNTMQPPMPSGPATPATVGGMDTGMSMNSPAQQYGLLARLFGGMGLGG